MAALEQARKWHTYTLKRLDMEKTIHQLREAQKKMREVEARKCRELEALTQKKPREAEALSRKRLRKFEALQGSSPLAGASTGTPASSIKSSSIRSSSSSAASRRGQEHRREIPAHSQSPAGCARQIMRRSQSDSLLGTSWRPEKTWNPCSKIRYPPSGWWCLKEERPKIGVHPWWIDRISPHSDS